MYFTNFTQTYLCFSKHNGSDLDQPIFNTYMDLYMREHKQWSVWGLGTSAPQNTGPFCRASALMAGRLNGGLVQSGPPTGPGHRFAMNKKLP